MKSFAKNVITGLVLYFSFVGVVVHLAMCSLIILVLMPHQSTADVVYVTKTPTIYRTSTPIPDYTSTSFYTVTASSTPTITFTPTITVTPSRTPNSKQLTSTKIAPYSKIEIKELITYPNNHIGELVTVSGRVFNINGDNEFQIMVNGEAVYVQTSDSFSDIYENTNVTVYGEVYGEICGINSFGAEICQPALVDAFYLIK